MAEIIWQRTTDCVGSQIDNALILLNIDAGMYFALNRTAVAVWDALEAPCSLSTLVDVLVSKYKVTREECEKSVQRLLGELFDKGLAKPLAYPA
jgi:hypothetical protein